MEKEKKIEKSRIVMYALELFLFALGVVFEILALTGHGMDIVPRGSQISSPFMAMAMGLCPIVIEKLFKTKFPIMLHIIFFVYCFTMSIIGSCLGLFHFEVNMMGEMLGWFDKVMHAILGYVLCVFAVYIGIKTKLYGKSKTGDILLIVAISMAFASLWEICEFTVDHVLPGQSSQRGSLIDTMLDMVCHFGLTIVFVVQYLIEKCTKINLGIGYIERNLSGTTEIEEKVESLAENVDNVA